MRRNTLPIELMDEPELLAMLDRVVRGSNGEPGLVARYTLVAKQMEDVLARLAKIEAKLDDIAEAGTSWKVTRDKIVLPLVVSLSATSVTLLITRILAR